MIAERRLTAPHLSLIANVQVNVSKDFISARREEMEKGAAPVEFATLRKFQVAPFTNRPQKQGPLPQSKLG